MGRRALLAAFILVLPGLFLSPASAPATEVYGLSEADLGMYLGSERLREWRVPEARTLVDHLLAGDHKNTGYRALEARVLFFEGHYREASQLMKELGTSGSFAELVHTTARIAGGFARRETLHFSLFWADPRDEILVDPATEALEAALAALSTDLGFVTSEKIRVEFYQSARDFTDVSTLTREEVRTSGTIGLCKFNRLMITSPRATLWGYGWRDTLAHELAHLAIYRLSRGGAPIWLHEGIARYFEQAWRGLYGPLDPASESLLARRLKADDLIPLDDMSPSVAKLPSAEETSLAFAQVGTMMTWLVQEKGSGAIPRMLELIAEGRSDREALEAVWEDSFASFEEGWRLWVSGLPLRLDEAQVITAKLDDDPDRDEDPEVRGHEGAKGFLRLGDLLRERNRTDAAGQEYAKAYAVAPNLAGVASRHTWGLLARERYDEAVGVTGRALELYPGLGVLWNRRGQALFSLGRHAEARGAFEALMEINPFHIPGRRGLLASLEKSGDETAAAKQRGILALLEPSGAGHP